MNSTRKSRICFLLIITLFVSVFTACGSGQSTVSQQESQAQGGTLSSQLSPSEAATSSEADISSLAEDAPEPEISEREKNWREDFIYFKKRYMERHPDPFYYVSEEEFDWQIDQLINQADRLSDMELYFEFSKIVAGLGDNHTSLWTPDSFLDQIFPVGVRYFGGKLYLCGYLEGYRQFEPYQLHEVVAVNGVDIKYLQKKAESIFSPTNEWFGQKYFEQVGFQPAFFDWTVGNTEGEYTLQLLDDDQRVVSIELPVITYDPDTAVIVKPENWEKLPRLQETGVSYYETEKGNFVYLAFVDRTMYDRGNFYHELMQQAVSLLKEHPDSKLVVDLRQYPGGDCRAIDDVKSEFSLLEESHKPKTYVITGGTSTSAAIYALLGFKQEFDAIQVGEPTGQFTSFWGFSGQGESTMPHSKITFSIANSFFEFSTENTFYDENGKLYEWENSVLPDVYVSQTIEDVRAGKDSVIEWVLEH